MKVEPLPGSAFGAIVTGFDPAAPAQVATLNDAWAQHGLLIFRGLGLLKPHELVALSVSFGEVEDMVETKIYAGAGEESKWVHPDDDHIFLVHGSDFSRGGAGEQPDAAAMAALSYPMRTGWHTDQSYRSPPPDGSLLYCVAPAAEGQADTFFADCAAAHDALPLTEQEALAQYEVIHATFELGRSREAVRANPGVGAVPEGMEARDKAGMQPQRHPLVRVHPVSGRRALYLGSAGQADFLDGPVVGLEPGPDGAGWQLLDRLTAHVTQPQFVYRHTWQQGDCVLYDNRRLVHAASWFDKRRQRREMWRTTVRGNPGEYYVGREPSWRVTNPVANL